jgi:hypothetical protein
MCIFFSLYKKEVYREIKESQPDIIFGRYKWKMGCQPYT